MEINKSLTLMYELVLDLEKQNGPLSDDSQIRTALNDIAKTYRRISSRQQLPIVNYDESRFRFAYIYLYGVCHTTTVRNEALNFQQKSPLAFHRMMEYGNVLNICSLGGGPGCDIIGLLCARSHQQSSSEYSEEIDCTVVDICGGWGTAFEKGLTTYASLHKLGGSFNGILRYGLVQADLCCHITSSVKKNITEAHIITLVKFVSAVSFYYNNDSIYLEAIFNLTKPGSFVFFLDNSTGGFFETVSQAADNCGLSLVYLNKTRQHDFKDKTQFSKYHFGKRPLVFISVICAIWKKADNTFCVCS